MYILYGVALQRLVDLNRDIKSLEYVSQISDHQMHGTVLEHVSVLKSEGEELTEFLLGNTIIPGFSEVGAFETIDDTDQCLPAVRLGILSQHIDIWCPHAGKKNMKSFLSQLIGSSVMSKLGLENSVDKGNQNKQTRLEQSSLVLLCDSVLYEHEVSHLPFFLLCFFMVLYQDIHLSFSTSLFAGLWRLVFLTYSKRQQKHCSRTSPKK